MVFIIAASAMVAPLTIGPGLAHASGTPSASEQNWLPPTPEYWPVVTGEQSTPAQEITQGATWQTEKYQTTSGAQDAQVMNVDLTDPNIRLGMVEAGNELIDPADETISSMANRTGAVAGVNADFFAIHGTGQPEGMVVQNGVLESSPVASWPWDLEVLTSGQIQMVTETFTGTATDTTSGATQPMAGVNRTDQSGLTLVTPFLGAATISASTVATAAVSNGTLTVTSVATGQTSLPQVPSGQELLMAQSGTAAATWLQGVAVGDTVTVSEHLAPFDLDQVQTAVSGGDYLLQNGQMAVPVTGGGENNQLNPSMGVGVTKDGKHLIIAVFNGLETEDKAIGVTRPQFAQWMLQQGAYNSIEFDSGGSAEMVARLPGQQQVSVLNTPSDGQERDVANGLFLYSTETAPAPAASATVNQGNTMNVLAGSTEPLTAFATDAEGNPASTPVSVSVTPAKLATVQGSGADMTLTAGSQAGQGWLVVQAGNVQSREPLTVAQAPASLSLSPAQPDLSNSGTQQFTLTGTSAGALPGNAGGPLTMSAQDATWSVSPSSLGTISPDGLFTAAADGGGLATVTATADGVSATASVAVGSVTQLVDPMTDVSAFSIIDKFMDVFPRNVPSPGVSSISDGSISASTVSRLPTDTGSIDIHYDFKPASTVYHTNIYPNDPSHDVIGANASGQLPTAYSFWIKTVPAFPGKLPAPAAFYVTSGYYDSANAPLDFNVQPALTEDWQEITVPLPTTTRFPIELNYINMVNIDPTQEYTGDMYVADLEADYSPRPLTAPPYVPIPDNPSWLQYVHTPADFGPGGVTVADFDDSHLMANNTGSTGTVVTQKINSDIQALPANAAPNMLQVNGDLTDTGSAADLQYGFQTLQSFGLPFHDAVGNHEISQGANPQNDNWTALFGPTHYSYTDGDANFIVTDSANGGLNASDPFQVPDEEQYAWMANQLTLNTSKVVFLVTHMPPYDPHVVNNSHFGDPYEAEQFEQLAANYQATHPQVHVILLFGHARGVSEQLLNPLGQNDPNGLPNFVVADAGASAAGYTPVDQGGFYNYALFHILPNGDVQFAIQPVLDSIAITTPQASLSAGGTEQLTATGTTPTGNDLDPLQVPIADPASHLWSSSDKQVATVDPSTGMLTAVKPGTATITVEAGGVTATTTVTVTS